MLKSIGFFRNSKSARSVLSHVLCWVDKLQFTYFGTITYFNDGFYSTLATPPPMERNSTEKKSMGYIEYTTPCRAIHYRSSVIAISWGSLFNGIRFYRQNKYYYKNT